jgi:hypothetical protein
MSVWSKFGPEAWQRVLAWYHRLVKPAAKGALALNLPAPAAAPRKAAPAAAPTILHWRGYKWTQQGELDGKGRLTFVRPETVNGKAVLTEVQVCPTDLHALPDGSFALNDRE